MAIPASNPDVAFVVCHHTGRLIDRCLASVVQTVGVTYETVVITSDPTYTTDRARQYYVEGGPAHKRNVGVTLTRAPIIIFLEDDVEISPYCAYEFWKFLGANPKCAMGFAKIYKMEEGRRDEFDDAGAWITWTGFLWSRAGNYQRDTGQFEANQQCLAGKSATCVIRRRAFNSSGGFDKDYYILGEETDLAWRCWLRGWECWYVPSAVSWHAFGCERLKPKKDYYVDERVFYRGASNYVSLLLTNCSAGTLWTTLPVHLLGWLWAAAGFALTGQTSASRLVLAGLWDGLVRRLPSTLRKRQSVQSSRRVSERVLRRTILYRPSWTYYLTRLSRYWTTQQHG